MGLSVILGVLLVAVDVFMGRSPFFSRKFAGAGSSGPPEAFLMHGLTQEVVIIPLWYAEEQGSRRK